MKTKIIKTTGGFNVFFSLFHLAMAYGILNSKTLSGIDLATMFALNFGAIIVLCFLAYTQLLLTKDIFSSRLGKLILIMGCIYYTSRAVIEIILYDFNPGIFGICILIAVGYLINIRQIEVR